MRSIDVALLGRSRLPQILPASYGELNEGQWYDVYFIDAGILAQRGHQALPEVYAEREAGLLKRFKGGLGLMGSGHGEGNKWETELWGLGCGRLVKLAVFRYLIHIL